LDSKGEDINGKRTYGEERDKINKKGVYRNNYLRKRDILKL
jgi:hypothetical protein